MKRLLLRLLPFCLLVLPLTAGAETPPPPRAGTPDPAAPSDYLALGMPLAARTAFSSLPHAAQGTSSVLPLLLARLAGAGFPGEALSLFEEVRPRLAEPVRSEAFLAAGKILWERGDREAADRAFRAVSGQSEAAPEAMLYIGRRLAGEGNASQAVRALSAGGRGGRWALLEGEAEMLRNNRAGARSAWERVPEGTLPGFAARIFLLSQGGNAAESVRALREIPRHPDSSFPETAAALEALSRLLLRENDPGGALDAAREGLRAMEGWRSGAEEAARWDGTGPGAQETWAAIASLFPYDEEINAFRRAGRLFLSRASLAEGSLLLTNRVRETARRVRGGTDALARSRETLAAAIRRAEAVRDLYRGRQKGAAATRDRLVRAADTLPLSGWGAATDPRNAALLADADDRIRTLRRRLAEVSASYRGKSGAEAAPNASLEDRRMALLAQARLERIERRISALEGTVVFARRTAWNRWKGAFAERASAQLERGKAVSSAAAEGASRAARIASRLRETDAGVAAWQASLGRMEARLSAREAGLAARRAEALAAAERYRGEALREFFSARSRRERALRRLAARAATEVLIAGRETLPDNAALQEAGRGDLLAEALAHWEASVAASGAGEPGADEALYAMAELRYEAEERRFFARKEAAGGVPDHSGALALFRRVWGENPASPYREAAGYGMALSLQEMGRKEESVAAMSALLSAFPETRYAGEIRLRLGEEAFDRYEFEVAGEHYRKVGEKAPAAVRATAQFKLGWSLFLRGKPEAAADPFLSALLLSGEPAKTAGVPGESLRMLARSLVDSGKDSEAERFVALRGAERHGPFLLMEIQSILDTQNRYPEAAAVADRLGRAYPASPERVRAEVVAAEALRKAGRPEESHLRRGSFHAVFGPGSRWQSESGRTPAEVAGANLLSEEGLRNALFFFHGKARQSPPGNRSYLLAGYESYLSLFPQAPEAGEVAYQRAWLLFDAGRKAEAKAGFEAAADRYGGPREEAARYMAVQSAKDLSDPSVPETQREVVRLARGYERAHPSGSRRFAVLLDRARALSALREFREAADAAGRAAQGLPAGEDRLLALRLSGDARFELGEFEEAERDFRQILASAPKAALRAEVEKWTAFSLFRRAERMSGEPAAALFAQVAREFPSLEIAPVALFRSGSALADAGLDREAIGMFLPVEAAPGNRALSNDATRRLALLYERSGQPLPAAERYERLGAAEETGDGKRALLLRAADLYAGSDPPRERRALLAAASLPDSPPGMRVLTLFRGAESARREGRQDEADRLYGETLKAHAAAPDASPETAGSATFRRGEIRFPRYLAMTIAPPLQKTFAAKQAALEESSGFYLEAIRLGDAETVSASLHRLGEGFENFRDALLSSPPPRGLSTAEQEEYRFLLEEKAAPIDEKAVEAYRKNLLQAVARDLRSPWAEKSLVRLKALRPARFAKRWEYALPVMTVPVFRGIVERDLR